MAKLPKFNNEDDLFAFFEVHSAMDFLDGTEEVSEPVVVERKQQPNKVATTIRLNPTLKESLKIVASKKGIRYQTLIGLWLTERLQQEMQHS